MPNIAEKDLQINQTKLKFQIKSLNNTYIAMKDLSNLYTSMQHRLTLRSILHSALGHGMRQRTQPLILELR